LKSTAEELGLPYSEMPQQAGHDAYAVATMAPTAMIFTPCFEGIKPQCERGDRTCALRAGANLLLNAAVRGRTLGGDAVSARLELGVTAAKNWHRRETPLGSAWESLFRDHFVKAAGHDPNLAQCTGT